MSKAVAASKQLDVKLTSSKAVCFSGPTLTDTRSMYANQISAFRLGLKAIKIQRAVPGVLIIIIKEYSLLLRNS